MLPSAPIPSPKFVTTSAAALDVLRPGFEPPAPPAEGDLLWRMTGAIGPIEGQVVFFWEGLRMLALQGEDLRQGPCAVPSIRIEIGGDALRSER